MCTNRRDIHIRGFEILCKAAILKRDLPGYNTTYAFFSSAFFAGLAGLDLPNEPLKILPFLVFLSPLPMIIFFLERQMYATKRQPQNESPGLAVKLDE